MLKAGFLKTRCSVLVVLCVTSKDIVYYDTKFTMVINVNNRLTKIYWPLMLESKSLSLYVVQFILYFVV